MAARLESCVDAIFSHTNDGRQRVIYTTKKNEQPTSIILEQPVNGFTDGQHVLFNPYSSTVFSMDERAHV